MTDRESPNEQAWGWIDPQTGERIAIDPEARRKSVEFLTSIPGALEYLEAEGERMRNRPPTITLMPEYGVEVPLWPQEEETDALVSEGLVAKLKSWQELFASNFGQSGWTSQEVKFEWLEEAVALEAELREEVAGRVEVEVDLWPVNPGHLHTSQLDRPPPT
jgi:hypothetical protein